MKTFSEYIEEKEILEESAISKSIRELSKENKAARKYADELWKYQKMKTPTETFENAMQGKKALELVGNGLGIVTSALVGAWIVSVLWKYGRTFGEKISSNFGFKNAGKFKENLKKDSDKPSVKNVSNKIQDINKKYQEELSFVYSAIKDKNWELAKQEYIKIKKEPGMQQAVIEAIIEVCKEPPIYITSPGNVTYKAIKKVLGQPVAVATAKLFSEKIKELGE